MNIVIGIPPFVSPAATVLATSTAHRLFPGSSAFNLYHPKDPWMSTAGTTQTFDIDMQSTRTNPALALGWMNFAEAIIYQSADAVTWRKRSPNLLKYSHRPSNASWTKSNTSIGSSTDRPSLHTPTAEIMTISSTNGYCQQVIDMESETITGATVDVVLWAKAGTTTRVQIGNGTTMTEFTLGSDWRRCEMTFSAAAGTTIPIMVRGPDTGTLFWGGAQASINTGTAPVTVYETNTGVVSPINPRTNRRACYLDLRGFSGRYTRILIPSQARDDGAAGFKLGMACPIVAPVTFHGDQNYPKKLVLSTPVQEVVFESGNTEVAVLGSFRANNSFNSGLVAKEMNNTLFQIARMAPGNVFVYFENDREPEGLNLYPDPSRTYFCKLASTTELSYSDLPEIVEVSLEFNEIT